MSNNIYESGDTSLKPVLNSDMLAIKVNQIIEDFKQKRVNDNKTVDKFELMVRQSFERLITAYKEKYCQTYADDSAIKERIAQMEAILEVILKNEEMFTKMDNKFKAFRAVIFCPTQTSEEAPKQVFISQVLANKLEELLNEFKNKRESDDRLMADFEKKIRLTIDCLINAFNEDFQKTYFEDEAVDQRLRRLEAILSEIRIIEDKFCRINRSFDTFRGQCYSMNSTS